MKQEFENSPENYLQNIADDLSSISGTCNEIKESQLNCATTDDLNNMGASVTSAVIEKVGEMKTSIEDQTQAVGGVGTEGLDSIESWFRDPERVKQFESEVKAYEDRVQETARALDQKQRLEEKINELNSKTNNKNSRK